MKKAGIILEVTDEKAVLMMHQGEIIEMKKQPDWKKGDLVTVKIQKKNPYMKQLVSIAACFLVLLLGGTTGVMTYRTEISVISMDINPSIEFGVNRFGRIISVRAMNLDGEHLLENMKIENLEYLDGVRNVLALEEASQKLKEQELLTFSVYSKNQKVSDTMLTQLQIQAESLLNETLPDTSVAVETLEVNEQDVTEAHHYGVTAGKYYYMQELQNVDSSVDLKKCSHQSIFEIKQEIEDCEDEGKGEHENNQAEHEEDSAEQEKKGESHHHGGEGHE